MTEGAWVATMADWLRPQLPSHLEVKVGERQPYLLEARSYSAQGPRPEPIGYETDILVIERGNEGCWIPRVVIEAKLRSVTTHDAITYSRKAASHKSVHPYLRYGIMLGERKHYPLPGRLFRHGEQFDFMCSFVGTELTPAEGARFVELVLDEVRASRELASILYESRKPSRVRYAVLQRKLVLSRVPDVMVQ